MEGPPQAYTDGYLSRPLSWRARQKGHATGLDRRIVRARGSLPLYPMRGAEAHVKEVVERRGNALQKERGMERGTTQGLDLQPTQGLDLHGNYTPIH